jgi:hypothetical protein
MVLPAGRVTRSELEALKVRYNERLEYMDITCVGDIQEYFIITGLREPDHDEDNSAER